MSRKQPSRDPLVLAGSTLALALTAALACIFPARRAASMDPVSAIRTE